VVGRRRRVVCDRCAAEVMRELEGIGAHAAHPPWACGRIEVAFGGGEVVRCALVWG
jgi:hypothetical protein